MSRVARWLGRPAPLAAEPSLKAALLETFSYFEARRAPRAAMDLRAAVVLSDGTGPGWTVRVDSGRFELTEGRARDAEATILSDPLTLAGIVRGKRSGLEAFLHGRLHVRGSLSVALKLDGLFERRERPTTRPKPHRVTAGGLDTFYLEAGSGRPVILLHGLGATNASMLTTVAALAGEHRVIAPDLPGFGDSEKPLARYDATFFHHWLVAFMDRLGVPRASFVGNSMGGRIAIETALRAPERVEGLALLAPSMAFRKFRQAAPLVKLLAPEMGAVPLPLLRAQVYQGVKLLFARPERLHSGWYEAATDEFLRVFRAPRGRVALFAAARQIYLEEPFGPSGFWSRLEQLRAKALFVWGERDRMVPPGFARHVARVLPRARSVVLPDCGHVPQFELPEATHALVKDFLRESPSTRASGLALA